MKVLFTGGGTGGHVSPAIAIAEILRKNGELDDCLFVGRLGGDENNAIINKGYRISYIDVSPIPRNISLKALKAVSKVFEAKSDARLFIKEFKPDVVIATGGYVSYPVLKASRKEGIPTVIHESNGYPGLVTRRLAKKCTFVLIGMESAKKYLKHSDNVILSGNPVKEDFLKYGYTSARKILGVRPEEKLIISFGGSGGADRINDTVIDLMREYSRNNKNVRHIHAVGRKKYDKVKAKYPELTKRERHSKCRIVPYIDNMPLLLNAADLAITRSGAMTLAELKSTGTPAILIPSPNVASNHQYYNAIDAMDKQGASVITENDLSLDNLIKKTNEILLRKRDGSRDDLALKLKNEAICEQIILNTVKRCK